jgi:molecular chaperone GrpE
MSDIERTLEEQPGSPDADASGDSARCSGGEAAKHAAAAVDAASKPDTAPPHGDPIAPKSSDVPVQGGDEGAAEVQGDLDELVKTAAQRDEYLALAQRTQADFENYRKRIARESAAAQERGMAALAKELLPALDNLDRALADAGKAGGGAHDGPLLEGVRLVRSELAAGLARAGIESFSPAGEAFDPSLHEAVATAPQPDARCQSGTVVEVYQPGYRLGSSVIRPARVVVAA